AYRIARGVPWQDAGTPAPAAGNGSAMRAAPVGLFFWDDPEALIAAAHDQGRITHQDPRCSAGAIAIAGATAIVLGAREVHPGSLCSTLSRLRPRARRSASGPTALDTIATSPRGGDDCVDWDSAFVHRGLGRHFALRDRKRVVESLLRASIT